MLAGIFTALSVAMGYLFLLIPNVELITATVFIAGTVVGPLWGLAVGALSELVYSSFNPYGAAMPPLLVAQVLCFALIGLVGGLFGRLTFRSLFSRLITLGACGLLLTLLFDVLTTLSFTLFVAGTNWSKILTTFSVGISFYATHAFINTLIFVTIVPIILKTIDRYLNPDSHD